MLHHIYHGLSPFKYQSPGSVFRCGRPGTGLLPASAVCDGYPDCPDGEDEARCPELQQPRYFAPAASADLQPQYYYDYPAPAAVQVTRGTCRRSESGYPPRYPCAGHQPVARLGRVRRDPRGVFRPAPRPRPLPPLLAAAHGALVM